MARKKAEAKRVLRPQRLQESERYVPTPECWAPSYIFVDGKYTTPLQAFPDHKYSDFELTVPQYVHGRVILDDNPSSNPRYFIRISFWGADDSGMEQDHLTHDLEEAQREYNRWIRWLGEVGMVTRASLRHIGFISA